MTHYIAMNGTHGCLPDSCSVHRDFESAIDYCADLLELSDGQVEELRYAAYVECVDGQGVDYAEIDECACATPWIHDENTGPEDFEEDMRMEKEQQ